MPELAGRVAIVTGGSRGIGRAVVRALVDAGASVLFATRTASAEAAAVVRAAKAVGGAGMAVHMAADVGCEDDVERLFAVALARWNRIDVVVHSAGVSHGALLVSLDEGALDAVLRTNTTGAFLVARRAARDVAPTTPRTLVLVGSLAQHGSPANAIYAASKGALVGLTRSIGHEQALSGLRTHLVVVGYVETELTRDLPERTRSLLIDTCPQRRAATTDEVAAAIVALAARPDALCSGGSLYVSGGLAEIPA